MYLGHVQYINTFIPSSHFYISSVGACFFCTKRISKVANRKLLKYDAKIQQTKKHTRNLNISYGNKIQFFVLLFIFSLKNSITVDTCLHNGHGWQLMWDRVKSLKLSHSIEISLNKDVCVLDRCVAIGFLIFKLQRIKVKGRRNLLQNKDTCYSVLYVLQLLNIIPNNFILLGRIWCITSHHKAQPHHWTISTITHLRCK